MKSRLLEVVLAALICTGLSCSYERVEQKIDTNSLYARIGGLNGMARAVDAMVNHVLGNKIILENKQLQMRAKPENVPGLKVQITNLMSSMTGGPETYSGRSMKDAHRGMAITEAQWDAFMNECSIGLDEAKVATREKQDVLELFASMKKDIVEAP